MEKTKEEEMNRVAEPTNSVGIHTAKEKPSKGKNKKRVQRNLPRKRHNTPHTTRRKSEIRKISRRLPHLRDRIGKIPAHRMRQRLGHLQRLSS
jgi:hypothetical protein